MKHENVTLFSGLWVILTGQNSINLSCLNCPSLAIPASADYKPPPLQILHSQEIIPSGHSKPVQVKALGVK